MDQNETLSGQGAEQENLQGEPVNQNNQSMEALLENDALSVELPQGARFGREHRQHKSGTDSG